MGGESVANFFLCLPVIPHLFTVYSPLDGINIFVNRLTSNYSRGCGEIASLSALKSASQVSACDWFLSI